MIYDRCGQDLSALIEDGQRLSTALRRGGLEEAASDGQYFSPFPQQIDIAKWILERVYRKWAERDFAEADLHPAEIRNAHNAKAAAHSLLLPKALGPLAPDISCFFGSSGTGKTQIVQRITSIIEQRRPHAAAAGAVLINAERLSSNEDLYRGILQGLDHCLGISSLCNIVMGGNMARELVPGHIITACLGHALGMLIIDHVEFMDQLPIDHRRRILDFLCQLSAEAGVPVLLVGTAAAYDVVIGNEQITKALLGDTKQFLGPIEPGEDWTSFASAFWAYQIPHLETACSTGVINTLYVQTQGIPRFLAKLLGALVEKLRPHNSISEDAAIIPLIEKTAEQEFYAVRHVLAALATQDPLLLRALRHFGPLDVDLSEYSRKLREQELAKLQEEQRTEVRKQELEILRHDAGNAETKEDYERRRLAMQIAARLLCEEAGCDDHAVQAHIAASLDELKATDGNIETFHKPKRYFSLINQRLAAEKRQRNKEREAISQARHQALEKADLRHVLRKGCDVQKSLLKAGYSPVPVLKKWREATVNRP
ncbi:ATP-binding protein [Croceicoccus mobilis]|uniref:ORC1/DEAH AAA+ ATPase domain-containing protein n=1 Tax=Croceicoccus mobilis TaxID=1703339 RepID=A0A917DZS6_9SPHN|nr:ATP-binding protein [Croceicoccus mobilis]GGD83092.1 hypothetical protein GCM10010990_36450 [Croceicoccus mobilis]